MPEMLIHSPEVKHSVFDYDITFTSGDRLPLTLDPSVGDTIDLGSTVITVHLESKPSMANSDQMLPAEDLTIFTQHVLVIQKRQRDVVELTPEEKFEWGKTMAELSKVVN